MNQDDGVTHINIYSKGETELGRWLSNFTKEYFMCDDGEFASIEAYWYWLLTPPTNPKRDQLKNMYGYLAKKIGRELGAKDWDNSEEFKDKIKKAMEIKLLSNSKMLKEFKYSILPFKHYYVYGGKIIEPEEGSWIIEYWEHLRRIL